MIEAPKRKQTKAAGTTRERQVVKFLRDHGWHAIRTPASQGVEDVFAAKAGEGVRLVQVKANHGSPYKNFQPGERRAMRAEAQKAGAVAELVWWPPDGKGPRWLAESDWPD